MKRTIILLSFLLILFSLSACSPDPMQADQGNVTAGNFMTGATVNKDTAGFFEGGFDIQVAADYDPVGVLLQGSTTQGSLYARISAADGSVVWKSDPLSGAFKQNSTVTSLKQGSYRLTVGWDEAVSATFNLYTVPGGIREPVVKPSALLGGLGMTLVAVAFLVYAGIKKLGWKYTLWGALAWIVTVAVKFAIAIPLNASVYGLLGNTQQTSVTSLNSFAFDLYVGLLTGVTEVLLVWLLLRYTKTGQADWNKALAFGIGFGAVEALLLGLSNAGSTMLALSSPDLIPPSTLSAIAGANHVLAGLGPVSERFFTILVHIFSNVLLFYGAQTKHARYFWAAFAYKSGIDAVASFAQLWGVSSLGRLWTIEGIIFIWGYLGFWGIRKIYSLYPKPKDSATQAL